MKWDMNKLREPQLQTQYDQQIHSKTDEIKISSYIVLEWDNVKTIIKDTANQAIGTNMNQRNAD
jgi:hypothetical protein